MRLIAIGLLGAAFAMFLLTVLGVVVGVLAYVAQNAFQ